VFLEDFPQPQSAWDNDELLADFAAIFAVQAPIRKQLEELRQTKTIGSSLDAQVKLPLAAADKAQQAVIKKYAEDFWREILIVSKVTKADLPNSLVEKATGEKCERCWHYSTELGLAESQFPGVCPKCTEALK
jgi:isoleucyl-tRNA synthetase